jgi:hypothetical protein
MNNLFYCYDLNLARFLKQDKNIPFITKARHLDTNKVFHLFQITEALQSALKEYKRS